MFDSKEEVLRLIEGGNKELFNNDIKLIGDIQSFKIQRHPFYLKKDEFDRILKWKLRGQFRRQELMRNQNTDNLIQTITKAAFEVDSSNIYYNIELKLRILCCLRGVGVPVASSILALCFPMEFAVIDRRNWQQVYSMKKSSFTISDYIKYYEIIKKQRNKYNLSFKDIDTALWKKNKDND